MGEVFRIGEAPVGADPGFAGMLPVVEDGGLAAADAAGLVDVLFLAVVQIRQLGERHAVELEVAGVAVAAGEELGDLVADAVMARHNFRQPAEVAQRRERRGPGRRLDEKRKVAVRGGQRAGEDGRVAGGGVPQQRFAAVAQRQQVGGEVAARGLGPAQRVGEEEDVDARLHPEKGRWQGVPRRLNSPWRLSASFAALR